MSSPATRGFLGLDPRGWPGTIVVALVAAAVALGLPALNSLVSSDRPISAGTVLDVGRGVSFEPARGWSLDAPDSDRGGADTGRVVIEDGPLALVVEAVPSDRTLPAEVDRLAGEIRARDGVQVFNDVAAFTTPNGLEGVRGSYAGATTEGRFAVLRFDRTAIRLVATGTPAAVADGLDDIDRMVDSLEVGRAVTISSRATAPLPRGWGDPSSVVQPRQPAFWLLIGLTAIGGVRIGGLVGQAFAAYPTGALVAVVLVTLYAIPFLAFVYRLDLFEHEPVTMVAAAFTWGGLVATSLALPGNAALFELAAKLAGPAFAGRWGPAIAAPVTEETLKVLGVVILVLIARDQLDSPLDGMVYGALIGLGFQVVEDFIYCVNAITLADSGQQVTPVVGVFVVRALVGLWSHAAYTAIAGFGVGYFVTRRDRSVAARAGVAVGSFAVACAAHFVWNSPLLTEAFGEGIGLLLGLVLKGLPVLFLLVAMYRMARNQEAGWFREAVAGQVGTDVLLPEELDELMTLSSRRSVTKMVRRLRGREAAELVGRLQQAQLALGLACSRGGDAAARDADEARRTIRDLRVDLAGLGVVRAGTMPGQSSSGGTTG